VSPHHPHPRALAERLRYANPKIVVHAFDLMTWAYSNSTVATLRTQFGRRFRMHRGDSTVTLPAWAQAHPAACDVAFVDGDHSTSGAMIDMINMREAVVPGAPLVADDINSNPGVALDTLRALGQVWARLPS